MFFIPRKLRKIDDRNSSFHESFTLEYLLNENTQVLVLLGEPGSGKSFLLKYFHDEHPNTSAYFSLANMKDEFFQENLENKKFLLLDSIDEGLFEATSQERFIASLLKNLEKNKDKKIVITCRSLEWRETFATRLEALFEKDSVKKFDFLPLGDDEIILICSHFGLNDYSSFKNFVANHYLQGFLQNIFMLIGMVQLYTKKELPNNSLEIYDRTIEKNLINYNDEPLEYTNEANEKENISPANAKSAVQTLAIYMTLLHKVEIEKKEADTILSNFSSNEVKAILNTKLFDTKNTKTTFIHKSIQEFLSAQFLHKAKIPFRKIKQLLTNKGSFLEAYEEVMVFYSNFQTSYFDEILNIDPFILRRHPTLNEVQEAQLFTAIMNLLQQDKTRLWGNWSKLYHTTLVQFKSIDAIRKTLYRDFQPSQLNDEQIDYLSYIVTNNDSIEIEEFLLKGLPDYSKEQEFPAQLLTYYCKDRCVIKLFDLLEKQNAWKNISDDYLQIFIDRLYNLIDFKRLIPLFKTIKYPHRIDTTVSLFSYKLVMQLFEAFQEKSNSRRHHEYPLACLQWFLEHYEECKRHNSNFLQWFFIEKLETLGYVYYYQPEPCFTKLSQEFFDDIFALYFHPEFEKYHRILELFERFFTPEALQSISLPTLFKTYPLDTHLRAYRSLINRLPLNEIELVKQHPTIQQWQKEEEKERIKTQKEYQKNVAKRQQHIDTQKQKYQMWLGDIDTYWLAIFNNQKNQDNFEKLRENLINDLQGNYPIFVKKLQDEFKTHQLYLKIQAKEASRYHFSEAMAFLFEELHLTQKLDNVIQTKEDYGKLFDYTLDAFNQESAPFFMAQSNRFQTDYLEKMHQHLDYLFLDVDNRLYIVSHIRKTIQSFTNPDFNAINTFINSIINFFDKNIDQLNEHLQEQFLVLITLTTNGFEVLTTLYQAKPCNLFAYLKALMSIDINKALEYFFNSLYSKNHETLKSCLSAFYEYQGRYEKKDISEIDAQYCQKLIEAYYENLLDTKPYHKSGESYTPQAEDNWERVISHLEQELKKRGDEEAFIHLVKSPIEALRDMANYSLRQIRINTEKTNFDIKCIQSFFQRNAEIIKNDDDLLDLLLETLEEIQKDFKGGYGIVNLLYKDTIHPNEALVKELKKNYDKELIQNYHKKPRIESYFQRLIAYMLNEKLKQKSFVIHREIAVEKKHEENKPDIIVSNGVCSVLIECKRDDNDPKKYVKEQLIDKYLSRSEYSRLIYLIAIYDPKNHHKLEKTISKEIALHQKENEIFPFYMEVFD
ncbi:ATP-binding protein [Sulfurospirillum sp. MES]|uniref:NACHT domain-containing protein n=1 Tax=Sulfurospirillum sp. MES TaxID=1565314 RepID=UPI0005437E2B|nr:ATP-binding protein [Sulfurospirillum sp. MES]KHG33484.1 MAG: hypothetical protein OA34_09185 [Sulfurospirillum sp. MES]